MRSKVKGQVTEVEKGEGQVKVKGQVKVEKGEGQVKVKGLVKVKGQVKVEKVEKSRGRSRSGTKKSASC